MIVIHAPGATEERFLKEILSPLGQPIETYTAKAAEAKAFAPVLAVVWRAPGAAVSDNMEAACAGVRRSIVIGGADTDSVLDPDARFDFPFRPGAIMQRARTLLAGAATDRLPAHLVIGRYDFYPQENRVHDKNTNISQQITDKERDIILTLHHAGGQPVGRQALLDAVWAYAPGVETHTLETHIYRLRQKIETDPAAPEIILTDEAGYRILPV